MPFTLLIELVVVFFSRSNHLHHLKLDYYYNAPCSQCFVSWAKKNPVVWNLLACAVFGLILEGFEWCALHSNCKNSNVPYLIFDTCFHFEGKKTASVWHVCLNESHHWFDSICNEHRNTHFYEWNQNDRQISKMNKMTLCLRFLRLLRSEAKCASAPKAPNATRGKRI